MMYVVLVLYVCSYDAYVRTVHKMAYIQGVIFAVIICIRCVCATVKHVYYGHLGINHNCPDFPG